MKKSNKKKKKINPFSKLLETRITDKTFKMIFFGTAGTVIGAVLFLLSQIQTLRSSYETIASQKSITILDESGNVFKKKLYETNMDVATIFGITYIKKIMGYGYLNYNRIINFIKVFSSKQVTDDFNKKVRKSLKQLKILNGTNIAKILEYKIKNKDNSNKKFILQAVVNKELVSESKNMNTKLFIQLTMEFLEPTYINSSGIFITKFEIEQYDVEKHQVIFEKEK